MYAHTHTLFATDIVAMLMDPISFASQALKEMEVGLVR